MHTVLSKSVWLAAPLACLLLAGCRYDFWNKSPSGQPSGQVAATVGGQEVTVGELRAELGGATIADPKAKKAAEQAALMAILRRKALANAAKEQKLDREPDYAVAKQRAEELALIQQLERKIAASVPTPTRDEAQQYISSHPDVFAQRKLFSVDEIRIGMSANQKLVEELKRLNTLEEIAAALTRENIPFARGTLTVDATSQDPRFVDAVVKLQPKDVMLFQDKGVLVAGVVRETKIVPFTGEPAINYAINVIKQQRVQQVVGRTLNGILTKAKSTIQFNKNYAPDKVSAEKPAAGAAH